MSVYEYLYKNSILFMREVWDREEWNKCKSIVFELFKYTNVVLTVDVPWTFYVL